MGDLLSRFGFGLGYVIDFIIMLVIGLLICLIAWNL